MELAIKCKGYDFSFAKFSQKFSKLEKVVLASQELNNIGQYYTTFIVWERANSEPYRSEGKGYGNTVYVSDETCPRNVCSYCRNPITHRDDLDKFIKSASHGWSGMDTWGYTSKNIGFKEFITLNTMRADLIFGYAVFADEKKKKKKAATPKAPAKPDPKLSKYGERKQTGTVKSKRADNARDAKPAGYRKSASGNIYYEARANRSDSAPGEKKKNAKEIKSAPKQKKAKRSTK